jgi:hypothetical protein
MVAKVDSCRGRRRLIVVVVVVVVVVGDRLFVLYNTTPVLV